jgi:pyruvate/2-oxoglutarate/acetoin dehydrogenase E1 component
MLKFAIRSDDPVVFIENAMLYGDSGPRGEDELIPFGSASVVHEGSDITVLSYSGSVRRALAAAQALDGRGISLEVIDLRSLAPLDTDTILASVAKTRRLITVSEDVQTAGVGAELCTLVTERMFGELLAAPARISAANTPVPFSPVLEEAIAPTVAKLVGTAISQMAQRRPAA